MILKLIRRNPNTETTNHIHTPLTWLNLFQNTGHKITHTTHARFHTEHSKKSRAIEGVMCTIASSIQTYMSNMLEILYMIMPQSPHPPLSLYYSTAQCLQIYTSTPLFPLIELSPSTNRPLCTPPHNFHSLPSQKMHLLSKQKYTLKPPLLCSSTPRNVSHRPLPK